MFWLERGVCLTLSVTDCGCCGCWNKPQARPSCSAEASSQKPYSKG